ncbi:MAG: hypothetical protein ACU837_03230 [Gammaproteobacteria bacterium]
MTTAKINTDMLVWARERSGIAVSEFAKYSIGLPIESIPMQLDGDFV